MKIDACIFTPDSMILNGIEFPAGYSIPPHGDGSVFVIVRLDEKQIRIRIAPDDPRHAAALAAACPQREEPITEPEQVQPEEPAAESEQPQPSNPDKQAHGPVPEKTWIGTSIQGIGWKIEFCPIMERTRLIFDRVPCKEARELAKAAGFAWSPKMGSWNKRLTWKAYRAAQKLAADLGALPRHAC